MEREIEIKELECPFCNNKEILRIKDSLVNKETKFISSHGIDYWECSCCGEANDICLNIFENDFKELQQFADKNNWDSLKIYLSSIEFDGFMLISLAKFYLQENNFDKAEKIASIILDIEDDLEAKELIEKIKNKDNKKRINVTFDDIETAFYACSFENLYFLDLKKEEIVLLSDTDKDEQLEKELEEERERFIPVPIQDSNENYRLMESFIHELNERGMIEAVEDLFNSIKQSKPFRRFKDTLLKYPEIREQWFNFENDIIRQRVCEWLRENNLICLKVQLN